MESEAAQGVLKGLCRLQTSPRQLTWVASPTMGRGARMFMDPEPGD